MGQLSDLSGLCQREADPEEPVQRRSRVSVRTPAVVAAKAVGCRTQFVRDPLDGAHVLQHEPPKPPAACCHRPQRPCRRGDPPRDGAGMSSRGGQTLGAALYRIAGKRHPHLDRSLAQARDELGLRDGDGRRRRRWRERARGGRRAARLPGRIEVGSAAAGQAPLGATGGCDLIEAMRPSPSAREGDPASVGRPGRIAFLGGSAGHASLAAAVGVRRRCPRSPRCRW